jgi:hypothetical protein
MLALIIPILNSVLGGIIKPFVAAWTDYERTKLTTGEAGFAAAAAADSAVMQAALTSYAQMAALKVQLYGTPIYRIITLIAGCISGSCISIRSWRARRFLAVPFSACRSCPHPMTLSNGRLYRASSLFTRSTLASRTSRLGSEAGNKWTLYSALGCARIYTAHSRITEQPK